MIQQKENIHNKHIRNKTQYKVYQNKKKYDGHNA